MPRTDQDLIGNTDALAWADEFIGRFDGYVLAWEDYSEDGRVIDLSDMIGWFANAIMAGFDDGYNRLQRDLARLKYALDHGWNRAQYEYACEKDLWVEDSLAHILPAIKTDAPKVPLGDPTEYELLPSHPQSQNAQAIELPVEVYTEQPTEHLYADEDVARVAQQLEETKDIIGDLLQNFGREACDYDETEWCTEHFMGRPCAVELARGYING